MAKADFDHVYVPSQTKAEDKTKSLSRVQR